MLFTALVKLVGFILFPVGIGIIVLAWLGYGGIWVDVGIKWLDFLNVSLGWAIGLTVVGGFVTSLGVVMLKS